MRTFRITVVAALLSLGLAFPGAPAHAGPVHYVYWASDRTGHFEIFDGAYTVGGGQGTSDGTINRRPSTEPGSLAGYVFDSQRGSDTEIYWGDNSSELALTDNNANDFGAAYSPTGAKIVFTSTRSGSEELWTMNTDGSNPKRLTHDNGKDENADWSYDGTKIAFYHKGKGEPAGVYTITPSGTNAHLISRGSNFPSWSPGGNRLAAVRMRYGVPQVFSMDPNGTNRQQITFDVEGATTPDWSPDGTLIAFAATVAGNTDIYTIAPNGTGEAVFVDQSPTGVDTEPSWR